MPLRIIAIFLGISLFGAGCWSPIDAPDIAAPLENKATEFSVSREQGFGVLPTIPRSTGRGTVTLLAPLPQIPPNITVIRLRRGTLDGTELRNIAAATDIPTGTVGDQPARNAFELEWTDDQGYRWTYSTSDRTLNFVLEKKLPSTLTVTELPSNDELIQIANTFLLARGIDSLAYRNALVEPDWNNWWLREKAAGNCMDISSLISVRAIGASDPFVAQSPPLIPSATSTACVAAEFPSHAVVRYRAFVDQRDVISANGMYMNGIELDINASQKTVAGGRIALLTQPDRSDYAGLTPAEAVTLFQNGGIAGISGEITITEIVLASYRLDGETQGIRTTYLIPALVGSGTRVMTNGESEEIRLVVPLLKQ